MGFSDVLPGAWFYDYIHWLYCQGVVQGYPDGTFRPGNLTTRGQIVKIVSGAFQLPTHTENGPHFTDVPTDQTFYSYIETAYHFGIITGYPCGGPDEPCDAESRPYFRPDTNVSRGQLSKIIVLTAQLFDPVGWALVTPPVATFNDVQVGSTFYSYVETAVLHAVVEGYPCGAADEPCPGRYFRPGGYSTRAQLAKMVFVVVVP